ACVVPTYFAGVQAGTGGNPGADDALADAWQFGATTRVVLPVYYSFSFATGEQGDFLSLAQALAHPPGITQDTPDGLTTPTLDLTRSGRAWRGGAGQAAPPSLPLPGVLRPADAPTESEAPPAVQAGLRQALLPGSADSGPQLRPPVYGGVQAGVPRADF